VRTDSAGRVPVGSGHVLEIDALERAYGSVRALDGMSFTVRPGAVTGFLGPNGAGKTTAMRAIFGLTALDGGEVRWQGRPVDAAARRGFGYLPEERGLYPTMRVGDQLRYLGRLRGLDKSEAARRAEAWLERLDLGDRVRSNLEDLSLGNQQRIQLISALVHEPDVLILDEPFSGLDPIAVDALSRILVSEARRGATVLFSSHQLDLVEDLCEDAVIVDHGRVVARGPLDELAAGHDPVLLIDVPSAPDAWWTAQLDPQHFTVLNNTNGAVRLSVLGGDGSAVERAQPVLDAAREAGAVSRFGFERRTLAEVFLDLVGRPADEDASAEPNDADAHEPAMAGEP
jgi:ABC-2 type transport system ATP-binding protein